MAVGSRVIEVARSEGVRGLWWRGLGVTVYRRLIVFARAMDEAPVPAPAKVALTVDLLDRQTIDEYLALRPDTTASETERRLGSGQRCIVARHDGRPVAARWFATGRAELPYLDLVFDLPHGVGYGYDVYTAPKFRGLGISPSVRPHQEEILRAEGCRWLVGTAMPENQLGHRLVTMAGYESVGTVGCLRLGPLRMPVRRLPSGYLGAADRLRT